MKNQQHIKNGEQLSQSIEIGYYKTMGNIIKTDDFSIEVIKKEMPSNILNMSDFFPVGQKNKIGTDTSQKFESKEIDKKILDQLRLITFIDTFESVTIIGNIGNIQETKIKPMYEPEEGQSEQCLKVQFQVTYEKNRQIFILIRKDVYAKHFVKYFNRIMRNKVKGEKYIFTDLKVGYYKGTILFLLQPTSYLMQVTDQYYQRKLKAIENIRYFKFSNLPLSNIYSLEQLEKSCSDGLSLNQIRQRFDQRQRQNFSIYGLIEIVEQDYERNSKKTKQLVILVYQTVLLKTIEQYGRCKVIVRYQPTEEQEINQLILNHHIYLFANPETVITEGGDITYILNNVRSNHSVIKLSENEVSIDTDTLYDLGSLPESMGFQLWKNKNMEYRHKKSSIALHNWITQQFLTVDISKLFEKSINRNLLKFHVTLLQIKTVHATLRCSKCSTIMKSDECQKCSNNSSNFRLWGQVRAGDSSGICVLSFEHAELIDFLDLHNYLLDIEKVTRNHMNTNRENTKGLTILPFNRQKDNKQKNPNDEVLFPIRSIISRKMVEKIVIGYSRMDIQETFKNLSENQQLDFHNSFQSTKKFMQPKKIFPNGIIEKKNDQLHFIPWIKCVKVLSAPPFS